MPNASAQIPSQDPDWSDLRDVARTRLRSKLRGFSPQDIEDLVQDVMVDMLDFVERNGPPMNAGGLVSVVAKRRAADAIRERERTPRHEPIEPLSEVLKPALSLSELAEILEEQAWAVTVIEGFFRSTSAHPGCIAIAQAVRDGVDLKQYSQSSGDSYAAVRQRWHRCRESLELAMRAGQLRLNWRFIRRKKKKRG